jgi:hypothetical protein
MFWRLVLHRIILSTIGKFILVPATLYATYKKLNRLPWGLDPIFGCEEDGWNGAGVDPSNPRKLWTFKGHLQGWYPNHKQIIWEELSFLKQWYYSYVWCGWRNECWNLRLRTWFAESIHFKDINICIFDNRPAANIRWTTKKGKNRYFKRFKLFNDTYLEYGFEFKPELFDIDDPNYKRIRTEGYTRIWKYRAVSVPSIRLRRIKEI